MKCPVCKTELSEGVTKCLSCGFSDLYHEFLNMDDAVSWMEQVVTPYKEKWEATNTGVSAYELYQKMMREQVQLLGETSALKADFEYELNENGAVLTKYHGNESVVKIPNQIDGHTVYKLGERLFYGYNNLKQVIIPISCTELGKSVFERSTLEEITFPASIKSIPENICRECSRLQTAIILAATKIGYGSFYECKSLSNLILPEEMDEIGRFAFSSCGLKKVILPKKIMKICGCAFSDLHDAYCAFQDDSTILVEDGYAFGKAFNVWGDSVFFCNLGSTAQLYATENYITYKPLNEFPFD